MVLLVTVTDDIPATATLFNSHREANWKVFRRKTELTTDNYYKRSLS